MKQIPNNTSNYDNAVHSEDNVVCTPSARAGHTSMASANCLSCNHGQMFSLPKVTIIYFMANYCDLTRHVFLAVYFVSLACRLVGRLFFVLHCFFADRHLNEHAHSATSKLTIFGYPSKFPFVDSYSVIHIIHLR